MATTPAPTALTPYPCTFVRPDAATEAAIEADARAAARQAREAAWQTLGKWILHPWSAVEELLADEWRLGGQSEALIESMLRTEIRGKWSRSKLVNAALGNRAHREAVLAGARARLEGEAWRCAFGPNTGQRIFADAEEWAAVGASTREAVVLSLLAHRATRLDGPEWTEETIRRELFPDDEV
jgi:hypothetical protein